MGLFSFCLILKCRNRQQLITQDKQLAVGVSNKRVLPFALGIDTERKSFGK